MVAPPPLDTPLLPFQVIHTETMGEHEGVMQFLLHYLDLRELGADEEVLPLSALLRPTYCAHPPREKKPFPEMVPRGVRDPRDFPEVRRRG
jgi:hypothetical protein